MREKFGENCKYVCPKCNNGFGHESSLRRHLKRKNPCDRKLKCPKCLKIFRDIGRLKTHLHRKTPCDPILGNTQEPLKNSNTCHFCYREFKSKYNLKRHFRTCKIRNGNMPILFQKIEEDRKRIEELEKKNKQIKNIIQNQIPSHITQNIQNNNINLQFNMGSFLEKSLDKKLINYGGLKMSQLIGDILEEHAPKIMKIPPLNTISLEKQTEERILGLVKLIHRNPRYPHLQNIFTQGAKEALDNHENKQDIDIYLWFENRWNKKEWGRIRIYLLKQILSGIGGIFRDKLKIKRNISKLLNMNPLRKRPEGILENEIFQKYSDTRDPQDILFLKIALILDREGLLDFKKMDALLEEPNIQN